MNNTTYEIKSQPKEFNLISKFEITIQSTGDMLYIYAFVFVNYRDNH